MYSIRQEVPSDQTSRELLLDRAFGRRRHRKTSSRLRRGRMPADGLAFVAVDGKGRLVATMRLWHVAAGSAGAALLLGPLAVEARHQKRGIGSMLMRHAIMAAREAGHRATILVGDEPYYRRFGFARSAVADLHLPGPVDRDRFLGLELVPGALDGAEGLVIASGARLAEAQAVAA